MLTGEEAAVAGIHPAMPKIAPAAKKATITRLPRSAAKAGGAGAAESVAPVRLPPIDRHSSQAQAMLPASAPVQRTSACTPSVASDRMTSSLPPTSVPSMKSSSQMMNVMTLPSARSGRRRSKRPVRMPPKRTANRINIGSAEFCVQK